MPHKHNPVACAALIAIHAKMPGLAATMLHAMPQEHERGLGTVAGGMGHRAGGIPTGIGFGRVCD